MFKAAACRWAASLAAEPIAPPFTCFACCLTRPVIARAAYVQLCDRLYTGGPDAGPPIQCGVTRFVCVNCTKTGKLSSRGLFLNRAAVRRHISAAKACFAADLGFSEIRVDARSGDVMAGLGGAAGPAPDVRHQPPGKQWTYTTFLRYVLSTLVAQRLRRLASMHEVIGSIPDIIHFFDFVKQSYIHV